MWRSECVSHHSRRDQFDNREGHRSRSMHIMVVSNEQKWNHARLLCDWFPTSWFSTYSKNVPWEYPSFKGKGRFSVSRLRPLSHVNTISPPSPEIRQTVEHTRVDTTQWRRQTCQDIQAISFQMEALRSGETPAHLRSRPCSQPSTSTCKHKKRGIFCISTLVAYYPQWSLGLENSSSKSNGRGDLVNPLLKQVAFGHALGQMLLCLLIVVAVNTVPD